MHSPNAICDRCGFKFPLSALRKEWTNLMVCSECWDYRHPQEFVRAVNDSQGIRPNMRPRPADYFLTTNEVGTGGVIIPNCTYPPVITGTPAAGSPLSCSTGTWAWAPTSYAYQWTKNGTDIPGETASTYTPGDDYIVREINCYVIARNEGGPGAAAYANGVTIVPPAQTELITNGTFDVDAANWTARASGSLSVVSNALRITNGGSQYGYAFQAITGLTIGTFYDFSVTGVSTQCAINLGTSESGGQYYGDTDISNSTYAATFQATSTTLYVALKVRVNISGEAADFDNVSLKRSTAAPMRWAPPAQTNPTIIEVGKTFWSNESNPFAPTEDFILVLPTDGPRTSSGGIKIVGGRHGRIIGGHMGPGRLLAYDISGSMFIEGVRWEMTSKSDCIGINARTGATPDWYFQNLNFSGVQGIGSGIHADMIQAHGLIGGTIHVHNVTGDSNYQGFFIPEDFTAIHVEGLKVSCANFRGNDEPDGNGHPIFLYMQVESQGNRSYPVQLSSVWCEPIDEGQTFPSTCKPEGTVSGSFMYWARPYNLSGVVYNGSPDIDFCPAASVGAGYVSRGYSE